VLQMLEKNPAGRPQNMAVVEAMLCDAQIAAHVQTEWDDLELPEVDEAWRKKLADHMPSPRSRRLRRLALGLAVVAILGLGAALFFGLRRPKEIVAYTPVFVEITKTDEAETVAPFLRKAAAAAEAEHYLQPVEASALRNIEGAEQEAHRLGTTSGEPLLCAAFMAISSAVWAMLSSQRVFPTWQNCVFAKPCASFPATPSCARAWRKPRIPTAWEKRQRARR